MHKLAKDIFQRIDFANRFDKICLDHSSFDAKMDAYDKHQILSMLTHLGYNFKYSERAFFMKENQANVLWHMVFNIKRGIFLPYLNISLNNEYLDLQSGHFGAIAYEVGDNVKATNMPNYSSYEEFEKIASEILKLYEDFKSQFLVDLKLYFN